MQSRVLDVQCNVIKGNVMFWVEYKTNELQLIDLVNVWTSLLLYLWAAEMKMSYNIAIYVYYGCIERETYFDIYECKLNNVSM